MNYFRYIFFHYIIFDLYNTMKTLGKISLGQNYSYTKSYANKRTYPDDELDEYQKLKYNFKLDNYSTSQN